MTGARQFCANRDNAAVCGGIRSSLNGRGLQRVEVMHWLDSSRLSGSSYDSSYSASAAMLGKAAMKIRQVLIPPVTGNHP